MPKRILEGATPSDRAKQRRKLGTLKGLTVQPQTRARYNKAVDDFSSFLRLNGIELPRRREHMDPLVCDYVEHLWSSGAGRAQASDTLAGLQDLTPKLRGCLPGAWRLLKTWSLNEVPNRAPPLPEYVMHAMCGWAAFKGYYSFSVSLLLGFYGMLRTGELLNVRRKDLLSQPGGRTILLNLGMTKGGKRAGAAESVVIGHDVVVGPLLQWMKIAPAQQLLTPPPGKWRAMFNEALVALKIDSHAFRPYSLRRGGATWWFGKHHSLDRILLQGRWHAAKTARIYINEGMAILAELQIRPKDPKLVPYLRTFVSLLSIPRFTTLEPPAKAGRSGGRGKANKFSRKRKDVIFFF